MRVSIAGAALGLPLPADRDAPVGDHEAAAPTAREAELMSVAMGMAHTAQFASYFHLCAAAHGVEITDDPRARLVRLLESCVEGEDPNMVILRFACQVAARVLAPVHDDETVALCLLQRPRFADGLPPFATDDIPDGVWAWAEQQSRTLTSPGCRPPSPRSPALGLRPDHHRSRRQGHHGHRRITRPTALMIARELPARARSIHRSPVD